MTRFRFLHLLVILVLLTACLPLSMAVSPLLATAAPGETLPASTPTVPTSSPTLPATAAASSTGTSEPTGTAAPTDTPRPTALSRSPGEWKTWPLIPVVPESMRAIYERGQQLGNNPHAFSVFGDCQSQPYVFMGAYDDDPQVVAELPWQLQETVAYFSGSFGRRSPTVRGGTTAAALLWAEWHQNKYGCRPDESPVACELRIHRPSFAIIHVGTHYEVRNITYLRRVIQQLIDNGVIPILATKADDREGDEGVNLDYATLAVEYDLPLWNFWAAVSSLPNRGLYTRTEVRYQGDVYLTDPARLIHRFSALMALDAVWRAVRPGP